MQVPASITSIGCDGFIEYAAMTAASLSMPKVSGVLYRFRMGIGVWYVNSMIGNGSLSKVLRIPSFSVTTDDTIPFRKVYFLHMVSNPSNVWFEQRRTSLISPFSNAANLADVFPMSMIKFTLLPFMLQSNAKNK